MTETQHQLAQRIHRLVGRVGGGNDERLLAAMADHMHLFKQLLDTSTEAEMNALAQTYPAFGRYAHGNRSGCDNRNHAAACDF